MKKRETNQSQDFLVTLFLWEQRESNPRPSACKADALNQLSYAPSNRTANIRTNFDSANIIRDLCPNLINSIIIAEP